MGWRRQCLEWLGMNGTERGSMEEKNVEGSWQRAQVISIFRLLTDRCDEVAQSLANSARFAACALDPLTTAIWERFPSVQLLTSQDRYIIKI